MGGEEGLVGEEEVIVFEDGVYRYRWGGVVKEWVERVLSGGFGRGGGGKEVGGK